MQSSYLVGGGQIAAVTRTAHGSAVHDRRPGAHARRRRHAPSRRRSASPSGTQTGRCRPARPTPTRTRSSTACSSRRAGPSSARTATGSASAGSSSPSTLRSPSRWRREARCFSLVASRSARLGGAAGVRNDRRQAGARREGARPPRPRHRRERQDGRDPERQPDRAAERRHRRDDLHARADQPRRRRRHERALSEADGRQAAEDRLPADALGGGDPLAAPDGRDRLDRSRPAGSDRADPRRRRPRPDHPGDRHA